MGVLKLIKKTFIIPPDTEEEAQAHREENAQRKMGIVREWGNERREFEKNLVEHSKAERLAMRRKDKEITVVMMNLMKLVRISRNTASQNHNEVADKNYTSTKLRVEALVKTISLPGCADELCQDVLGMLFAPNNELAKRLTKVTNSESLKLAISVANSTYNIVKTGTSVVAPILSNTAKFNNAVLKPMSNVFITPVSRAIGLTHVPSAIVGPLVSLLSHGVAVLTIWHKTNQLNPLLDLWMRYDGFCSCCGSIKQVTDIWEREASDKAMSFYAPYAAYLAMYKLGDAISNYVEKKRGNPQLFGQYWIADSLWQAGKNYAKGQHKFLPGMENTVDPKHCPFALLALATLFGKGNPSIGYPAAVAALMSDSSTGKRAIQDLL